MTGKMVAVSSSLQFPCGLPHGCLSNLMSHLLALQGGSQAETIVFLS